MCINNYVLLCIYVVTQVCVSVFKSVCPCCDRPEDEIILRTPRCQSLDLNHSLVILKFKDVAEVGGGTVVCVEGVEKGAKHTALWGTDAECKGVGEGVGG